MRTCSRCTRVVDEALARALSSRIRRHSHNAQQTRSHSFSAGTTQSNNYSSNLSQPSFSARRAYGQNAQSPDMYSAQNQQPQNRAFSQNLGTHSGAGVYGQQGVSVKHDSAEIDPYGYGSAFHSSAASQILGQASANSGGNNAAGMRRHSDGSPNRSTKSNAQNSGSSVYGNSSYVINGSDRAVL